MSSIYKVWIEVPVGKIKVLDYAAERKAWMENVIAECTDQSMTPKEKMEAIETHMCSIAKYVKNYNDKRGEMQYLDLVTEKGLPEWKLLEWDSFTSPLLLEEFGTMIGYPVTSLFDRYERGTDEWHQWHWYVQSNEDGFYYSFCQLAETNRYENVHSSDDVENVDFLNYEGYYDCQ